MASKFSPEALKMMERFRALGEPRSQVEDVREANPLELTASDAPALVELLRTEMEREGLRDANAAIWAWRALGTIGRAEDLPVMMKFLLTAPDDDEWVFADLPPFIVRQGEPALDALLKALGEDFISATDVRPYDAVMEGLEILFNADPLHRRRIREGFRKKIADFRLNPPVLNAYLLRSLAMMADPELKQWVDKVFKSGFVDEKLLTREIMTEQAKQSNIILTDIPTYDFNESGPEEYQGDVNFARLLAAIGVGGQFAEHKAYLAGVMLSPLPADPIWVAKELRTDPITRVVHEFRAPGQAEYYRRQFNALWTELSLQRGKNFPLEPLLPHQDPAKARPLCDDDPLDALGILMASENLRSRLLAFRDGFELSAGRTGHGPKVQKFFSFIEDRAERLGRFVTREPEWVEGNMTEIVTLMKDTSQAWSSFYPDFARDCLHTQSPELN